ncbi:hypothetical protein AAG906_019325 [Vitis piasezkii]|uniref:ATP-dependent Clp protease proteolytic subunit n=1 Tax=Vitis vinifera TaxID=29760 RepID=A0A438HPW1_VITVI|nr:ATP-dependent Clp protease proteolytic subunit [Vitis vinifera]
MIGDCGTGYPGRLLSVHIMHTALVAGWAGSMAGKSQFHCRAVCNSQKMPVRVMIHQPAAAFYEAQAGEFVMEAEELLKLREIITKVYVQRTGKPLWVVSEDLERDVFMSATEAQTHGIVDLVAVQ